MPFRTPLVMRLPSLCNIHWATETERPVGPDYKNVDFSLQKNFPIWESLNFQFRSEFFNIFNHTNYGNPPLAS